MNRFLLTGLLSWALVAAAAPTSSVPAPRTAVKPTVSPVRTEGITPQEMVKRSASSLTEMRSVLSDSLNRLEEARSSKDVVKLNCVNEKLTQVKGLLRISEQADVALQEAVAKKEQLAGEHEFTKITIASEKVRALRAEAEECIGQLAFRADQNLNVEVEIPNNLPTSDPTTPPRILPPTTRPPPASPTQ